MSGESHNETQSQVTVTVHSLTVTRIASIYTVPEYQETYEYEI